VLKRWRILWLAVVSVLSGCTFNSDCPYGIVAQSQPARCMSRTEYYAAREQLRHSLDKTSPKADKKSWATQTKDRIDAIDDK
jgi:hypothetical protein